MREGAYELLGVNRNASVDEVKAAYRSLASRLHPDKGGSNDAFQKLQTAYNNVIQNYNSIEVEKMSLHFQRQQFLREGASQFKSSNEILISEANGLEKETHEDGFAKWMRENNQSVNIITDQMIREKVSSLGIGGNSTALVPKKNDYNHSSLLIENVSERVPVKDLLKEPWRGVQLSYLPLKIKLQRNELLLETILAPMGKNDVWHLIHGDHPPLSSTTPENVSHSLSLIPSSNSCERTLSDMLSRPHFSSELSSATVSPYFPSSCSDNPQSLGASGLFRVKQVGEDVTDRFSPNDLVISKGYLTQGTWRTVLSVCHKNVIPVTSSLPEEVGALSLEILLAYKVVENLSKMVPDGGSVVVSAPLSSTGVVAIQLLRSLNIPIIALLRLERDTPDGKNSEKKGDGKENAPPSALEVCLEDEKAPLLVQKATLMKMGVDVVLCENSSELYSFSKENQKLPVAALDLSCTMSSVSNLLRLLQNEGVYMMGGVRTTNGQISFPITAFFHKKVKLEAFNIFEWMRGQDESQNGERNKEIKEILSEVGDMVQQGRLKLLTEEYQLEAVKEGLRSVMKKGRILRPLLRSKGLEKEKEEREGHQKKVTAEEQQRREKEKALEKVVETWGKEKMKPEFFESIVESGEIRWRECEIGQGRRVSLLFFEEEERLRDRIISPIEDYGRLENLPRRLRIVVPYSSLQSTKKPYTWGSYEEDYESAMRLKEGSRSKMIVETISREMRKGVKLEDIYLVGRGDAALELFVLSTCVFTGRLGGIITMDMKCFGDHIRSLFLCSLQDNLSTLVFHLVPLNTQVDRKKSVETLCHLVKRRRGIAWTLQYVHDYDQGEYTPETLSFIFAILSLR